MSLKSYIIYFMFGNYNYRKQIGFYINDSISNNLEASLIDSKDFVEVLTLPFLRIFCAVTALGVSRFFTYLDTDFVDKLVSYKYYFKYNMYLTHFLHNFFINKTLPRYLVIIMAI